MFACSNIVIQTPKDKYTSDYICLYKTANRKIPKLQKLSKKISGRR